MEPWNDPTLPHDDVGQLLYGYDRGILTAPEVLWGMLRLSGQHSVSPKGTPAEWLRATEIVTEKLGASLIQLMAALARILP